jgi:predicted site-specific integrase-resolvase
MPKQALLSQPLPLLVRSPLFAEESLASYLARLSFLNAHQGTAPLRRLCQERLTGADILEWPLLPETYAVMAGLTLNEVSDIYTATPHRFAAVISPPDEPPETICLADGRVVPLLTSGLIQHHFWPVEDARYCPVCLQAAGYHRLSWSFCLVSVCLEHQCLLIRGCPHCRRALHVRHIVERKCPECAGDLSGVTGQSAARDNFGLMAQQSLMAWLGLACPPMIDDIAPVPPAVLYRLLFHLCRALLEVKSPGWFYWHRDNGRPASSPKEQRIVGYKTMEPAQSYLLAATAFKALINWPDGFYAFLGAYQMRDRRKQSYTLQSDFGAVYLQCLEKYWRAPEFQFVQTAFDDYLIANFPLTPSVLHSRRYQETPGLAARFPFMPVAEAARSLQTTPAIVERLVRREMLTAYQPDKGKRRSPKKTSRASLKLVGRAGVLELQARWETAVPLADAAAVLGLSKSVVLDLVEIGVLAAVRGPAVDETNSWQLAQESITGLVEQIEARARHYYDRDSTPVNLTYAAQVLSPYGYNVAGVIQLMLEDKIRCYWGWGHGRKLADLRLMVPDLTAVLEDLKTRRPFVTRRHIAEQMGVKTYIVGRWVKHGLIQQEYRRGVGWYFSREVAERFIREHLFSDEAAEMLQIAPLVVQKWVRNGRLHPVSGPGIDGGHRYLFRREEIARYRPENRLTLPQLAAEIGMSRAQVFQWVKQGKLQPVSGPEIDGMGHYLFLRSELEDSKQNG